MIKKWFMKKLELTRRLQEENMILAAIGGGRSFVYAQNAIAIEFNIIKMELVRALIFPFVKDDPTES